MRTAPVCRVSATGTTLRFRDIRRAVAAGLLILLFATVGRAHSEHLTPWQGPAPTHLDLPGIGGGTTKLADFSNRVVIVHFFATWCEPCGPELAALEALRRAAGGDDLAIVAVSVAEPEVRVRRFFEKQPAGFPVFTDIDRTLAKAWGVAALPSTFVLGPELRPLWQAAGVVAWDEAHVRQALKDAAARR